MALRLGRRRLPGGGEASRTGTACRVACVLGEGVAEEAAEKHKASDCGRRLSIRSCMKRHFGYAKVRYWRTGSASRCCPIFELIAGRYATG